MCLCGDSENREAIRIFCFPKVICTLDMPIFSLWKREMGVKAHWACALIANTPSLCSTVLPKRRKRGQVKESIVRRKGIEEKEGITIFRRKVFIARRPEKVDERRVYAGREKEYIFWRIESTEAATQLSSSPCVLLLPGRLWSDSIGALINELSFCDLAKSEYHRNVRPPCAGLIGRRSCRRPIVYHGFWSR